jgi:hypothetical protein
LSGTAKTLEMQARKVQMMMKNNLKKMVKILATRKILGDGLMRSIVNFWKLFGFLERTGTRSINMWSQEVVPKLDLMLRSTSTN